MVAITKNIIKEEINDMGTKHNVVKEAITPPIAKIILTQSKKQINHNHPKQMEIHPAAINLINLNHWENQSLLKNSK